ncbi:hypothetical protein D8M04_08940 [Oceanobacillus piezotolerans]|uniref:Phospholipase C/D domain-containing protein n=1 Tax=Oceanobacillus piezotolerans TaxID=2448030 RepID=A0A498DAD5_9BACI|nr:zinc dependent phospholipase C family protein [Oceanobacillus piezotolerans]RLL44990.1 hypothetical protein D8M04_08940 [Oceanobacillus piezotolerans]
MPNIWTHILFSEEVIDAIDQSFLTTDYEAYIKLGAQGPDPFFYHNFWSWIKNKSVHEVGMALHTKNCGTFLMDMIQSATNMSYEIKAYVIGFVTHHILDRNAHPYIHYAAGYEGNNHAKLEIIIDTLMMEKFHHVKTWKTQVYKEIYIGKSLDNDIRDFLHQKITKHYPGLHPKSGKYISKAYKDMILALKLLSDPYGWKNKLFGSLINPFSHQPIKDNIDYLNTNHHTWHHSATGEEMNESFIDLYNQARVEGIEVVREILRYWDNNNEFTEKRLSQLVGNISYDTGKPLELQLENKYSYPII